MRRSIAALFGIGLQMSLVGAHGQERAMQREAQASLYSAKSLRCVLGAGIHTTWSQGIPGTKPAQFASEAAKATMVFDSIDIQRRVARLIGEIGATDVSIISDSGGLTFTERTPNGPNVTTVYPYYNNAKGGRLLMVQSRHMVILPFLMGSPAPSQYYGSCEVLE